TGNPRRRARSPASPERTDPDTPKGGGTSDGRALRRDRDRGRDGWGELRGASRQARAPRPRPRQELDPGRQGDDAREAGLRLRTLADRRRPLTRLAVRARARRTRRPGRGGDPRPEAEEPARLPARRWKRRKSRRIGAARGREPPSPRRTPRARR